jgi:endonuclease/exonuclease/phosphatase family metal-dependent hydrolase
MTIKHIFPVLHFSVHLFLITLIGGCHSIQDARGSEVGVNVMTFNIRNGKAKDGENCWSKRKDMLCDFISDKAPDILPLQEAYRFQLDEILEALPEFHETGLGRGGGTQNEYSAILYRHDRFELLDSQTFWLSDTPEIPSATWGNRYLRICTWARFYDKETDGSFYVFNTHLDHESQPSREKSIRHILEIIRTRNHKNPYILTGDLNAEEDNPIIDFIKGQGLVDTFRVLHPKEENTGTIHLFTGKEAGSKIDYIFVEPGTETVQASIDRYSRRGRYPSDHFPVTAVILLN